ncbi:MAG: hypothetical protein ABIZ80_19240 [Bryobacteraceae bacterium]
MEYTEEEAASALGVSIAGLRVLVRRHITKDDTDSELTIPSFRPTDVLLLKMLSKEESVLTQ